jgi:HK97 family phage major capsid protein
VDAEIAREQKLLDLAAEKAFPEAAREIARIGGGERKLSKEVRDIYVKWLRGGDKAIANDEWPKILNVLSTGTGSEGGFTVQTEIARDLVDALKAFGGMREVSEIFATAQGNPMNFPTSDGTAEVGELIAENVTATGLDPVFGTVGLNVFKFSSKIIACPIELLQDSEIDMEGFLRNRIQQRLGRITNQMFTTGTGSAQPRGVVVGASAGKVGITGQTLTVIYDDLIDLIHAVDPAYRGSGRCALMMNDSSVKVIRKIKDTSGRPIWVPGDEQGMTQGVAASLLGYRLVTNQDVAVMAANAKSILFGDFNYYKIRDVMTATLFRFTDSAYTKLGQVGFLAWMRAGGNLVDTAAVKYYQNSAT